MAAAGERREIVTAFVALLTSACTTATISLTLTSQERRPLAVVVGGIFFAAQGLGAFLGGRHCDLYGRKNAIHRGFLITLIGLILTIAVAWDWGEVCNRKGYCDWSKMPWNVPDDTPIIPPHLEGALFPPLSLRNPAEPQVADDPTKQPSAVMATARLSSATGAQTTGIKNDFATTEAPQEENNTKTTIDRNEGSERNLNEEIPAMIQVDQQGKVERELDDDGENRLQALNRWQDGNVKPVEPYDEENNTGQATADTWWTTATASGCDAGDLSCGSQLRNPHDCPLPKSARLPWLMPLVGLVGCGCGTLFVGGIVLAAETAAAVVRRQVLGELSVMIGAGPVVVRLLLVMIRRQPLAAWVISLAVCGLLAVTGLVLCRKVSEPEIYCNQVTAVSGSGVELLRSAPNVPLLRPRRKVKYSALWRKYMATMRSEILGCCIPCFLSQGVVLGSCVFHFLLINRVRGFDTERQENIFALTVLTVSLSGYCATAWAMRHCPPKLLQVSGFTLQAFVFFGLALCLYSIAHAPHISEFAGASLLYDVTFRVFLAVTSVTTAVLPVEAFPTVVRGSFLGLSHFAGQMGALVGVGVSWWCVESRSRTALLMSCSIVSIVAVVLTRWLTPHVKVGTAELSQLDAQWVSRLPVVTVHHFARSPEVE